MYPCRHCRLVPVLAMIALVLVPAARETAVGQSATRPGYSPAPPRPKELPVTLVIRLPASALLDIEGVRTRLTGEERRFQSPPLPVGQRFVYTLKGMWKDGDKEIVRERKVEVRAGDEVTVDLRQEPPKNEAGAQR
jgi:uncharacterized protein (TIGR03000 family)